MFLKLSHGCCSWHSLPGLYHLRVLLLLACVSCFWLLYALRGNASADNFFCQLLLYLFYYIVSILPNSSMHLSLLFHIPQLQGTKSTLYWDRRVVKEMHQHISLSGNCHIPWWQWLLGDDSNISDVKTFIVNHALIQSLPVMLLITGNSMQCFNAIGQLEAWEF